MRIVTTDTISDGPIEHGEVVCATAIAGANLLRDMREAITNTFGGAMSRYESLFDRTMERALATLAERAKARGYDGVVGVKVSHPVIVTGAIEIVVTGTGFKFVGPKTGA